jgi:predicted NAD/FAD-binding protein
VSRRVAVIGAGWAGLAGAVECAAAGAEVTLFEMSPLVGGRARDVAGADAGLDNGQHI